MIMFMYKIGKLPLRSLYIYEGRFGRRHCDLNMLSSESWKLKKTRFWVRWLGLCYIFCTAFIQQIFVDSCYKMVTLLCC